MPVRAIKKIELGLAGSKVGQLAIRVPQAIIHSIRLRRGDIFVCEFKNHFNGEQKLIREINETIEVPCRHDWFGYDDYETNYYLKAPHIIILTDLDITKNYGFLVGEHLEIIFKEVKREKESISIFPERMTEDLDSIPK